MKKNTKNGSKKPEKRVHEARHNAKKRQEPVMKAMAERAGAIKEQKTDKQILIDMGYSESYAESGHIKDTKVWRENLDTYFPDSELFGHTKQLLNASNIEHYSFPLDHDNDTIRGIIGDFGFICAYIATGAVRKTAYFPVMNATAKKDALNMIYKLKKYYDDELTVKHTGLRELSSEELRARIASIVSGAVGTLARGQQKNSPLPG